METTATEDTLTEHGRETLAHAEMVDLKFTDLFGSWQHLTIPKAAFDPAAAVAFDGSSIRGWQGIEASDMLLVPDLSTIAADPFSGYPTASIVCDVTHPDGEGYDRDPRGIAARAEAFLRASGVADTCFVGPEAEFFVFDSVSYELEGHRSGYAVDSAEGHWNAAKPGLGYTLREKGGYFPAAPHDTLNDLRAEMSMTMIKLGLEVECHHHEVASAGQCEIDLRFQPLRAMADQLQTYKYVVRNVALRHGKTATFMPKPIFGDNGSGMHTHLSLWQDGETLMADDAGYAGLSELALQFVAGILMHAPALLAFCAPTTNSYRRLVPGYEAPVNLVYSAGNRSAAIRIPSGSSAPKARRVEFRCPDPTANPYIAFSALMMAGLDGITNKLDPGEPANWDLFEDPRGVPQVPGSLDEALTALEHDNEFLTRGGVFSRELIDTWIGWKHEHETDVVRLRPHPAEFSLYYDA